MMSREVDVKGIYQAAVYGVVDVLGMSEPMMLRIFWAVRTSNMIPY